jgi:hypothetical protein
LQYNILMTKVIAIQLLFAFRYCNKYIVLFENHQYNNNIIVRTPGLDNAMT